MGLSHTKAGGKLTKWANSYIVRTFPKVIANPDSPTLGKYWLNRGFFERIFWIFFYNRERRRRARSIQYQPSDQQVVVDPGTLNDKQRLAFDIFTSTAENDCGPFRMIVSGTAGTGKTYSISAQKQVLRDQCIVATTTGIPVFRIGGQTVHSAATSDSWI